MTFGLRFALERNVILGVVLHDSFDAGVIWGRFGRIAAVTLCRWHELKAARHENRRSALIAVAIHVFLVLQSSVESECAAFLRMLIDDLGVAPEDRHLEPISNRFAPVADLDAAIVGDGKIDDWCAAIREPQFRLNAKTPRNNRVC